MNYISIPNWRRFQHYNPKVRQPPWIKVETSLMSNDDFLRLSPNHRGVLLGVWLEYARSRCELPADTFSLSRRIGLRVSKQALAALNHAGFIEIVASKTLAEGYQPASASRARREVEVEVEGEQETTSLERRPRKRRKTATPAKPKPAPPARRDELWDTFDNELGKVQTKSERGRRNRALKDLRDIGVTPDQLRTAIHAYQRLWPGMSVTETAIAANWSTLQRPMPNGRKLGPVELMALHRGEPLQ